MSAPGPRVLAVGLVTLDVVQGVDRLPRSNHKQQAEDLFVDFGGPAANAAGVAAGLGASATLVTGIGSGPVAGAVHGYLERAGVGVLDLTPDAELAFGVSTVLVEREWGFRSVVSTNARDLALDPAPAVRAVAEADVVLVDGHRMELCLAVAAAARRAGVPVVFDGGSWKPGTDELLRWVDVAVVSADFAPPAGTVEEVLRSAGVTAFGQSLGELPWELESGGVRRRIAVPEVHVVDTVGAGDALHGALAYAVGLGGLDRVVPAAEFASEVASLSCAAQGARGWLADPALVARVPRHWIHRSP